MLEPVLIRPAAPSDADAMAELLTQLGYPAAANEVIARLREVDGFGSAIVLVAELGGRPLGLATGLVFPSIHISPPVAWLTTLVIAEQHAGKGIGRRLVDEVERWAWSRGAIRLGVTSGANRDGAHAFYERIGYERTGIRFTKALGNDDLSAT